MLLFQSQKETKVVVLKTSNLPRKVTLRIEDNVTCITARLLCERLSYKDCRLCRFENCLTRPCFNSSLLLRMTDDSANKSPNMTQ